MSAAVAGIVNHSDLAQAQQALLHSVFGRAPDDHALARWMHTADAASARGLMAYRAHAHALAERSLRTVYPVVEQLMGADNFAGLARELWHKCPPERGDLAQWGEHLPHLVETQPALADVPYLADVCRVEWALHRAASATDAVTDLPSFGRLSDEDPDHLTLRLAPGACLLHSDWPVASVVLAHSTAALSLHEAGRRVQAATRETAWVWRQGHRPCVSAVQTAESRFLGALLKRQALTTALDAAQVPAAPPHAAHPEQAFDLSVWLQSAVQAGWVLGVAEAAPHSE